MLASTTLSLAPRTRPATDGAALASAGVKKSLPATNAAAATPPTRVAKARRDIAFWSVGSKDTVTSWSAYPTARSDHYDSAFYMGCRAGGSTDRTG